MKCLLMLFCLWSFSVFAEESRVMLNWTSFPSSKQVYEFYLKEGNALYLIRNDAADQPRDDDFPYWDVTEMSSAKQEKIMAELRSIIRISQSRLEEKKEKGEYRGSCKGFQWGVDIRFSGYDVRYGNRCDSLVIRDRLTELVGAAMGSINNDI